MLSDDDFYDYLGGMIDGRGTGLYGMLGNDHHNNLSCYKPIAVSSYSSAPVPETYPSQSYDYTSQPVQSHAVAAQPPKPNLTDLFATKWTEDICDMVAERFEGMPAWVSWAIRIVCAVAFLVVAVCMGSGFWLATVAGGFGWFVPRATLLLLRCGLYLLLSALYIGWHICLCCAMLGIFAAVSYGIYVVINP